jgi:citrate lyase beta subunit
MLPRALFLMTFTERAPMNHREAGFAASGHAFPIVNNESTLDDLRAIVAAGTPVIGLAGCRKGADIQRLATLLSIAEAQAGRVDGERRILALTDGILPAPAATEGFTGKSPRLAALVWDRLALENALATATPRLQDGTWTVAFATARAAVLLAAAAAGIPAYDCACDLDGKGFQRDCEVSRNEGFYGRIAMDAAQAAVIEATYLRD